MRKGQWVVTNLLRPRPPFEKCTEMEKKIIVYCVHIQGQIFVFIWGGKVLKFWGRVFKIQKFGMQKCVISWGNFGHKLVKHEPNKFFKRKVCVSISDFWWGNIIISTGKCFDFRNLYLTMHWIREVPKLNCKTLFF